MASITLTPSENEIQAFVQKHEKALAPSKNPYIRYFLKLPQASVSIYTSGKVLLQGEAAERYASFFGYQVSPVATGQNFPLIGTDEVGNGSYFVSSNHRKVLSTSYWADLITKKAGVTFSSFSLQEHFS